MVSEETPGTHTVFIQLIDASYRPRAVAFFDARPGASEADLASAGRVAATAPSCFTSSSPILHTHLTAWPATGHGTAVVEIGDTTRGGGRLVAVRGVTVQPPAFLAWLRASPLARAVARAYAFPEHLTTRASSAAALLEALPPPPPGAVVRVMAFPRSLEAALLRGLPEATWPALSPTGATHVLVAVDTRARSPSDEKAEARAEDGGHGGGGHSLKPCVWAALLPPSAVLADTEAERSRDVRTSPTRATAKLEEALAVVGLAAARGSGDLPGDSPLSATAIDVGAAPGGWTQHLARCGRYGRVIAVEPGDLDQAVAALAGVTHIRARAEDALAEIKAAIKSGDALADLLTCDANIPVQTLGDVLGPVVGLLRVGAPAIITLKTFSPSRVKDKAAAEVGEALAKVSLRVVWCLWLVANTRCERTLVCERV